MTKVHVNVPRGGVVGAPIFSSKGPRSGSELGLHSAVFSYRLRRRPPFFSSLLKKHMISIFGLRQCSVCVWSVCRWSYGVLLWELYSHGDNPFPSVPLQSLYHTLCAGYQMPRPDDAADEMSVYSLYC